MNNNYLINEETAIAYEQLSQEDRRLLAILDTLFLGVMIIEPGEHRIAYVNPEAARMMNRSPVEMLKRVCHGYICPFALGKCPITDLGQQVDQSTRCVIDRLGHKVPIFKSVKHIWFNAREHLLETFMDIRDVTEKERLIGVLEMAGAAAHHLSQPLQAIMFELYDLLIEVPEHLSGRIKALLESTEEMRGIIKNIQKITDYQTREYVGGARIVDIFRATCPK